MKRVTSLSLATVLLLAISPAFAQQPVPAPVSDRPVTIKDITGFKIQTPEYQIKRSQTAARTRDWFQIITTYDTDPEWVDEVQFTYYVLVKNKNPASHGPPQSLFKGEVSYINVEKGKHKSDMFIHPSTLSRYGDVQAIAVLMTVQGRLIAMESKPPSNQRWWEALQPQDGYLLNRMQTPFAMLYFDDYEAVKPK
jgi:hypothetical protein